MPSPTRTIFLIASRTGGPLIPLLALRDDLLSLNQDLNQNLKQDLKFMVVGVRDGVEEKLCQAENLPLLYLPEVKIRREAVPTNRLHEKLAQNVIQVISILWTALGVVYSCCICLFYLLKHRPKLILSTSNFLSVPLIWTTALLNLVKTDKTRVAIHLLDPQNTTIKLTAKFADLLTTGFSEIAQKLGPKAIVCPNPVRRKLFINLDKQSAIQTLEKAAILPKSDSTKPLGLIFGGGSGAKFLNQWVVDNLDDLLKDYRILHLTGFLQKDSELTFPNLSGYKSINGLTDLMPAAYLASDFVICRAGMSTISELIFLQKKAFLVPIPDSHQEQNAYLARDYLWTLHQKDSQNWLIEIQQKQNKYPKYTANIYFDGYQLKHLQLIQKLLSE